MRSIRQHGSPPCGAKATGRSKRRFKPLAVIKSQGSRRYERPHDRLLPAHQYGGGRAGEQYQRGSAPVYEYARSALVRQSRNKIPPLTETELACERLALEQAILRVQAEQGRRSSRDPSRTYSSDVRPQEPAAERAPPCHAVPSNPAPGPRSQPNPSSARGEASARREPPPVARREQAVPPCPTTSGVGARDVANQPPPPHRRPACDFPCLIGATRR